MPKQQQQPVIKHKVFETITDSSHRYKSDSVFIWWPECIGYGVEEDLTKEEFTKIIQALDDQGYQYQFMPYYNPKNTGQVRAWENTNKESLDKLREEKKLLLPEEHRGKENWKKTSAACDALWDSEAGESKYSSIIQKDIDIFLSRIKSKSKRKQDGYQEDYSMPECRAHVKIETKDVAAFAEPMDSEKRPLTVIFYRGKLFSLMTQTMTEEDMTALGLKKDSIMHGRFHLTTRENNQHRRAKNSEQPQSDTATVPLQHPDTTAFILNTIKEDKKRKSTIEAVEEKRIQELVVCLASHGVAAPWAATFYKALYEGLGGCSVEEPKGLAEVVSSSPPFFVEQEMGFGNQSVSLFSPLLPNRYPNRGNDNQLRPPSQKLI